MKKTLLLLFFVLHLFPQNTKYSTPTKTDTISSLQGLYFYDDPNLSLDNIHPTGIDIQMLIPNKAEFTKKMSQFLGKPFTKGTIHQLKKEVYSFLRNNGFPISGVYIPEKQIFSTNTVSVLILMGRIGIVKAEGAKYFSNTKIANMFRSKPGQVIRDSTVNDDLYWMNLNPFRTTTLVYEPGNKTGETNATLITKDRFPLRVYSGYENTGNPLTGTPRYLAGLNWGNALGLGHELNYLFITEPKPKNWFTNIASYIIPLPWHTQFRATGSITFTTPDSPEDFFVQGKGWQLSGRFTKYFTLNSWEVSPYIGYEFKRSNNFVSFGVLPQDNDYVDVSQFVLGSDANLNYEKGTTSLGLKLLISPGNMTSFNKTKDFETQRLGSQANYIYSSFRFDQILKIKKKWSWVLNTLFQVSNAKLLPSEEFALGGYYTIRGYDEFECLSDNGVMIKNELRLDAISIPNAQKRKHDFQILLFSDFGISISDNKQVVDNINSILASIGPGLRYQFGDWVFVRMDWGKQLSFVNNLQTNSHRKSRLHFGAQMAF